MKKRIISALLIVLGLIGLIFGYLYLTEDEPAATSTDNAQEVSEPITSLESDNADLDKEDLNDDSQPIVVNNPEDSIAIQELETEDPTTPTAELPVTTNHYTIEQTATNSYKITLYAILNNPNQYDEYTNQLTLYKAEALEFLETNNFAPSAADISYLPLEAGSL